MLFRVLNTIRQEQDESIQMLAERYVKTGK